MKRSISAIKWILFIVFCVVLLLFGLLNVLSGPGKSGLAGFYGYTVVCDSMEPTFGAGDYVIVQQTSYADLAEGDVVTYLLNGDTFITHRLYKLEDGAWQLKGDRNDYIDEHLLTADNYVGSLLLTIPNLGGWLLKMKHPLVLAVIGLIIAVYLLYLFWRSGRKAREEE